MEEKYYEVTEEWERSFYSGMIGKLVLKTSKTILLEFNLSKSLGGHQQVMFLKNQVKKRPGYKAVGQKFKTH